MRIFGKKRKDKKIEDEYIEEEEDLREEFFVKDPAKEFESIQRMMNEMIKGMLASEPFKGLKDKDFQVKPGKPMVYGFSIKMGPQGRIRVDDFGNLEPSKERRGKPIIKKEREPLVDVMEYDSHLTVLAELPGVEKQNIHLTLVDKNSALVIDVPKKFYKEVRLPVRVKPQVTKAHYKNGVLEVELTKQRRSKPPEQSEIPVE